MNAKRLGDRKRIVRMRTRITYLFFFFLAILFWTAPPSNAAGPSFPSKITEIPAPSGHYAVTWKQGGSTEEEPNQLFLKNLSSGRVTKILEFHRQVNILWAPNGRFVAVTDWTGSNVSQVLLFQPGKKKVINLADCLHHSLGKQPDISKSVHVYFEAISWKGPKKLLFKVFGDAQDSGDSGLRGFEHYFEFDISGMVRKVEPENDK